MHLRIRSLIIIIGLALGGCGGQSESQSQTGFAITATAQHVAATTQPVEATSMPAVRTHTPEVTTIPVASPVGAGEATVIDTTSLAVPEGAIDLTVGDGMFGKEVTYRIDWDLATVIDFYNNELAPFDLTIDCSLSNAEAKFYSCSQSKNGLSVFLNLEHRSVSETHVNIELSDLNSPAPAGETSQETGSSGAAEIKDGLPLPDDASNTSDESGPFRRSLATNSALDIANLVKFYRAELPSLGWTEDTAAAKVEEGSAVLIFANEEGPLVVELTSSASGTDIRLTTKALAAATAAGILGKPGQARIIMGNMGEADATITIDGQELRVAAGEGVASPNGPTLDLAPGTYTVMVSVAGQPDQEEHLEVSADEVWGLMLGPGGILPLQLY